jgi:hypothetical protein
MLRAHSITLLQNDAGAPPGGARNAFGRRWRHARPNLRIALTGACLWSLAMAISAGNRLYGYGWQDSDRIRMAVGLYLVGGLLAFPIAFWVARMLSLDRPRQTAFASFFVALGIVTIGLVAAIFALQYRIYYAEWHADAFTKTWMLQFTFTTAGALYQFAVLGLRLFVPLGPLALLVAAFWFARLPR